MHKLLCVLLASSALISLTGCAGEAVDEADEPLVVANALDRNGIAPNGIAPNGIAPNGIAPNALSPSTLTTSAMTALQDPGQAGDLSRMFLRYAVSCAFDATQSFSFSWTDSAGTVHNETYVGSIGLATGWATGPLNDTGARMVSACLAARTNYFGTSVLISMRAPSGPLSTQPSAELAAYPYVEGAFWGNIFTTTPWLYACSVTANAAHSQAAYRDCATGYPDPNTGTLEACGIITLAGSCSALCNHYDTDTHAFSGCVEQPSGGNNAKTSLGITTALP